MNPSTADLLGAVDQVNATSVIILPNNGNIRMAAEAAASACTDKKVAVVPTKTVPQAFSALFAVLPDSELEDAVAAIRAMLDQAPDPVFAGDSAYVAALAGASQILADEARAAGAYSGKEPFNFAVAVLFPAAQVSGSAPQVPTGLLTHQVSRF